MPRRRSGGRPATRGQQHPRQAAGRDALPRLCMACAAPPACPAKRSTQVSCAPPRGRAPRQTRARVLARSLLRVGSVQKSLVKSAALPDSRRRSHLTSSTPASSDFCFRSPASPSRSTRPECPVGDEAEARHRRRTPVSLGHRRPAAGLDPDASSWAQARATNYLARSRSGRPLFGEALVPEAWCGQWRRSRCRRSGAGASFHAKAALTRCPG